MAQADRALSGNRHDAESLQNLWRREIILELVIEASAKRSADGTVQVDKASGFD